MSKSNQHGTAAEDAVREVAAVLGLPDFVFTVPPYRKGNAVREVGDALLIANGTGGIVQVKARHPDATDDGAAWVAKHGAKALKQAQGTRRTITEQQRAGSPLTAIPVRVAHLEARLREQAALVLDHDVQAWPVIVVIDHPGAAGQPPPDPAVFWITLDDWHQLMRALRSVTALLDYVTRVLAATPPVQVNLGEEQTRFLAVVDADARAGGRHGRVSSQAYTDPVGAQLYRELAERVWPGDRPLPTVSITDYRAVVEFLDAVPPGLVPQLGRWLLRKRAEQQERGRSSGLAFVDQQRILVFVAETWNVPEDENKLDAMLIALATVRSAEASAHTGRFVPVLAVGHLVAADSHIDYRYVTTRGPVPPTQLERSLVLHNLGALDPSRGAVMELSAEPGENCPCGSGLPFADCRDQAPAW